MGALNAIPERHLYRVAEAATLLSMSRSVIYEQMRSGRLQFVKQGASTLIPHAAIKAYVRLLMSEAGVTYEQAS